MIRPPVVVLARPLAAAVIPATLQRFTRGTTYVSITKYEDEDEDEDEDGYHASCRNSEFQTPAPRPQPPDPTMSTHYPKRRSLIKRARKFGFRARMRTSDGRKMLNRKRRVGRSVNVRRSF